MTLISSAPATPSSDYVLPDLPYIGAIAKGKPNAAGSDKGMSDLSYFRFRPNGDPQLLARWKELFPGDPKQSIPEGGTRRLRVMFPFPDAERNFQVAWFQWIAGGLGHKCHDETMVVEREYDPAAKSYKRLEPGTLCAWRSGQKQRGPSTDASYGCKRKGVLYLLVPEVGYIGYMKMETGSNADIATIRRSLKGAEDFLKQFQAATGRPVSLMDVPFILSRSYQSQSTITPDRGMFRRDNYPVALMLDPEWSKAMLDIMSQTRRAGLLAAPAATPLLTDTHNHVDSEEDIIDVTPTPAKAPQGGK